MNKLLLLNLKEDKAHSLYFLLRMLRRLRVDKAYQVYVEKGLFGWEVGMRK